MDAALGSLAVATFWVALAVVSLARFDRWERPWLAAALAAHLAAAPTMVWLHGNIFAGGDMSGYFGVGRLLSDAMRSDFARHGPEVFKLLLQMDAEVPWYVRSPGSSTATMQALSAWIQYVFGNSMLTLALVIAGAAFYGKLLIYRSLRTALPAASRQIVLIGVCLLPSAVLWSSGFLKEAVAMPGLGLMVFGTHRLAARQGRLFDVLLILLGAWIVLLVKAYLVLAFAVAGGTWLATGRSRTRGRIRLRPGYIALGAAVAIGAIVGVGSLDERFAFENLDDEAARLQSLGVQAGGGSTYQLGTTGEVGLLAQVMTAPLALFAALFRPLIIEPGSAAQLVNAIEMSAVLLLFVAAAARQRLGVFRMLSVSPTYVFCVVFVLTAGLGIGLATTNLGTLSRYRMPMMPFYIAVLATWYRGPILRPGATS
jgi:hypothetical protein